ncbi:MAG: CHAT domain-containing protein [Kovacikia sp.]
MKSWYSRYRLLLLTGLALFGFCLSLGSSSFNHASAQARVPLHIPVQSVPVQSVPAQSVPVQSALASSPDVLWQSAKKLYEAGQFSEAIAAWTTALHAYQQAGDRLGQASTLSNLSLAQQQLGRWTGATDAIRQSLALLQPQATGERLAQQRAVLAQALNTQGRLYLELGQPETALSTWQRATAVYQEVGDKTGMLRSQINQAEALRLMGLQRRALDLLTQVVEVLQAQPDSLLKAIALRRRGESLQAIGDWKESQQSLQRSLAIAKQIQAFEEQGSTLLSLAHLARGQSDESQALALYQQIQTLPVGSRTRLYGQLSELSLWIEQEKWQTAQKQLPQIQALLKTLPPSHTALYAHIHFAQSQIALAPFTSNWAELAQDLTTVAQQAKDLGDQRAESYALGYLGQVYEQTQQWAQAQVFTQQALVLAQTVNAPEILYRWQWQSGRILKARGQNPAAIAAYSGAVDNLKSLRNDLIAINSEIQFSYRRSVEPVYRELVSLLLTADQEAEVSQQNLIKAREAIESLQLAELDNYFQQACLQAKSVAIDQIDPKAAVIYPIILSDRLEMILRLPNQPLRHYSSPVASRELTPLISNLKQNLVIRSRNSFLPLSQQLYDWLMRPLAADIKQSQVNTLVFVLDGALRNIPMAALHDGTHYLLEDYRIALAPGLQLLDPQPLPRQNLKALLAGLTESRQGFAPLDYVAVELKEIQSQVSNTELINETFTSEAFRTQIEGSLFPVVHIATHGQFSSSPTSTFILAWDKQIDVFELEKILQVGFPKRKEAIELLVLSACETAAGDQRAALGLAGIAIKAGARSTLATLWAVNDEVTATVMHQFYQGLRTSNVPKAELLRQAQLALLHDPQYSHPLYWAPYLLVGNWL